MKRIFKGMNLQLFAEGENNNRGVRVYQNEFKQLLQAVFGVESYFSDFFVGGIEALDGVRSSDTAFTVKTSDIPVAIGTYSKEKNVGMGTGTGSTSRFGDRTEVIYTDKDVPYTSEWAFHEGIDRSTVNNDLDAAVADRLDLQAQAVTEKFNSDHGKFISSVAYKTVSAVDLSSEAIIKMFNELSKYFVNAKAKGVKAAKVTADVYNAIVDCSLTTTSKASTVNIDGNEVLKFKGFLIKEVPDEYFQENEIVYAHIQGIAKAFTGINTTRTIESEDFDGYALQGHGKSGEYIPEDNKKAVAKVVLNAEYGLDNLTVTSAAGTATGDTKITVAEDLTEGNMYKYKVTDNAVMPAAGQNVRNWANWDGTSDITAATGKEIVIVECNDKYEALKAGVATVTAKA